jgi:menaquinone-specific isochorismate synthase
MSFFWPRPLPPSSYFRAQTFYPNGNVGIWADFPSVCTLSSENQITLSMQPANLPRIRKRVDTPSFPEYQTLIADARQKIAQGSFQKVVLARQTTLTFDAPINPHILLQKLLALPASPFMIELDSSTAFLGATPEKLFIRKDQIVETEAVAGTIARNEIWTSKERAEFDLIHPYLEQKLQPLSQELYWEEAKEKGFGSIRHLSQSLRATLHSPTSNEALIAALHPTPALAGFPSSAAISYLRSIEPFDRGFYGAPIGTLSDTEADILVAIRSMLIRGNEVHLFAGGGIVLQSCPLKEWEELDRKIAHALEFFI